jgi:hypothetical protein
MKPKWLGGGSKAQKAQNEGKISTGYLAPLRRSNDAPSSTQKQTQKGLKAGPNLFHEQFQL